jgi:hypothetical protein
MKERSLPFKVLLILLPTALGLQLLCWITVLPKMARGYCDFRQLYVAGYVVRTGAAARLYEYDYQLHLQSTLVSPAAIALPFIRPSYQALVFAPLSLVSYRAAYFIWLALNAALVALLCYWLRNRFRTVEGVWKQLPIVMLCLFYPISLAMLEGQDSILLLALLSCALVALERKRESLAGCLIALGLFKFQIVLPIALLFVVWNRWKFAKGFFSTAFALAGISLALIGVPGIKAFYRSLSHIPYPVHYEVMSNLHGLLVGIFGNSHIVTLTTLALSAAIWLTVAKWSPVKSGPDALMIAIPTAVLVSYYLYGHDWSVLILPLLFTMNFGMHKKMNGWAALLAFYAPLVFLFARDHAFWASIPIALLLVATCRSLAGREPAECAPVIMIGTAEA